LPPDEAPEETDEDPLEQGDLVRSDWQGFAYRWHGAYTAIYDEIKDNYNGLPLAVRTGSKVGVLIIGQLFPCSTILEVPRRLAAAGRAPERPLATRP
jgi:hypothetical protein